MHRFNVSADEFYKRFQSGSPRIRSSMQELISRYGIHGKDVLSVGPGVGEEERHFAEAGNRLTFVDIDEHGSLLPNLQDLPKGEGITYIVGDANELMSEVGNVDVLYSSGFTPDERNRGNIVRRNSDLGKRWSIDQSPFSEVLMGYAAKVRNGGLMIVQSYYDGVDTHHNPDYLAACERQLAERGFNLLEVHRFKFRRQVMLYTAVKGEKRAAPGSPNSQFHGRAVDKEAVERIYPDGLPEITPWRALQHKAWRVREMLRR